LPHPGKVFWLKEGYTKLDLVEHYNAIFPKLSLYLKNRMLGMVGSQNHTDPC
jgi:DNA primase